MSAAADTEHLPHQLQAGDAPNHLEHLCALDILSPAAFRRVSSIICTIGPASKDPEMLEQMMETGMNIARLNFSHGSYEYHAETIVNIRQAVENYSKKIGRPYPVAIALDTKGPEIRTGLLEGGDTAEVKLVKGATIKITTDKSYAEKGTKDLIYVDYENIHKVVKVGGKIYIDDGLIALICTNIQGLTLICTIENGGALGSKKGVNLPGMPVDLPAVSEKDKQDLLFGVEQGVDMIFASFIRNGAALNEIRNILGERGSHIKLISKIENQQGMDYSKEIIDASDGIMVARGDLGIEIPTEKVFLAQKCLIANCNKAGKPVICATQMLESMTSKPRPTRAESSDVANAILGCSSKHLGNRQTTRSFKIIAKRTVNLLHIVTFYTQAPCVIFNGADCVMLSGESAKGKFPVLCVETMAAICREAEAAVWQRQLFSDLSHMVKAPINGEHAICMAAVEAATKCLASAIIVLTTSGKSAHMVSKYRPKCPIITVTRHPVVARQLHLWRACVPVIYEHDRAENWIKDVDDRVRHGVNFGKSEKIIRDGDVIVIITGWKRGSGSTNTMRVITVNDENLSACAAFY